MNIILFFATVRITRVFPAATSDPLFERSWRTKHSLGQYPRCYSIASWNLAAVSNGGGFGQQVLTVTQKMDIKLPLRMLLTTFAIREVVVILNVVKDPCIYQKPQRCTPLQNQL